LATDEQSNVEIFPYPERIFLKSRLDNKAAGTAPNSVAIYTSSLGNYFFLEARDLFAAGLRELGLDVVLHDERDGFAENIEWHLVVAPHEFFYLGEGQQFQGGTLPQNLILFNTEQPSTQWYVRARDYFPRAKRIWDINYQSSLDLKKEGFACDYLPLGFVSDFAPFAEITRLPEHYGTWSLEKEVREGSYLRKPLCERPIDILFLGTMSERREAIFAGLAPVLAKYRCYVHLPTADAPLLAGVNTPIDTVTSVGLAQRSKILLNIHRSSDIYFEWHRIVMHGIWNRSLVISEPCSVAPPFKSGLDFVEAPTKEIAARIEYYLSAIDGQREGQEIASRGFKTLSEQCKIASFLEPLVADLKNPQLRAKVVALEAF
jgi:hypothetical protein